MAAASQSQSPGRSPVALAAVQKPNPWHVSFSYARALQNTVLKTWQGQDGNRDAAQEALLRRAKANSEAQLGKYTPEGEDKSAAQGMYEKGYTY